MNIVFSCPHVLIYHLLQRGHYKCDSMEWLYGPMFHWPEAKAKEKKRIITLAPPVLCKCGVEAHYGLVPSEHVIGHWCDHMVDYDEVGYFFWKT